MCTKTNEQATSIIVRRTEIQNPCAMARESQALPDFRQTITCKQWVACSQIYIYIYIYTCTNDATGCYTQTTRQKIPRTHMSVMNIHALQRAVQALSDSTRHNKEWPMQQQGLRYTCVCFSITCRSFDQIYNCSSHGTRGCANPQAISAGFANQRDQHPSSITTML